MDTKIKESAGPFPETADIETASEGYATRFRGPVGQWMLDVQSRAVLHGLKGVEPGTVVDVGGGHGQLVGPLCASGYRVTVIGSDASCSQRIQDRVAAGECEFFVGNVLALPFADRSFDAAVSVRLLPHCARWPELIAELCRVTRDRVVVDFPKASLLMRAAPWLFALKRRLEGNTRTWTAFTGREIEAAFGQHGFSCKIRYPQFFFPMVLHRVMRCAGVSALLESAARGLGLTRIFGSPIVLQATREDGPRP